MGVFTSFGRGRYVASEADSLWLPRTYRRDGTRMGVIYAHGGGQSAASLLAPGNGPALMRAIASTYPVAMADLGVVGGTGTTAADAWGNTNAQTRLGQLRTWLQASDGGGAKTGKVAIVGGSMGATLALNYARNNPTHVSGVVGLIPAVDLDDIRDNDRGGGPETGYTTFLGSIDTKTTGTTLVIPMGSGVSSLIIDDLIVVAVTTDGTSTTPSIADTKSNTWQTDQNVTQATTANGIRTTVFSCVLTTGKVLTLSDTITVTTGSVAARVATAHALRGNPATNWKDTSNGASGTGTAPTTTTAAFVNAVVLAFGVVGFEDASNNQVTQPTGWTDVGKWGTTGGSGATNVGQAIGVRRFSTAQAVTYNPAIQSADWAALAINYKKDAGYRGSIDSAWGVTYPTALPAGANPADNTGSYGSMPIRLWYASDDDIVIGSTVATFASAVGANAVATDLGAFGHTDTAIGQVPIATVLSLIDAWTAL